MSKFSLSMLLCLYISAKHLPACTGSLRSPLLAPPTPKPTPESQAKRGTKLKTDLKIKQWDTS